MRASVRSIIGSAVLVSMAAAAPLAAQDPYPKVTVSGRLQEQFYWFDNAEYAPDVGPGSDFFLRRARIEARAKVTDNVSLYIQPSFEGGRRSGVRLRDAYVDVRLGREGERSSLYLRAGQEKRPFSRYELLSSNNLPSIERGAGQGLPGAASNDLFADAGFLSHDVGASLRLEHELDGGRAVTLKLGAYNGEGESLSDVNGKKSFGARATVGLAPKLDLGASWYRHDGIVTDGAAVDSGFTNSGFDLDAQYGKPGEAGLFALAEYLQGDDATAAKRRMRGFQAVAAYNIRMKTPSAWLYAVEPSVRFDFADPDADADADRVTTVTATLGLYLSSRAWLRVAYERQSSQADGAESVNGVRSQLAVNF